jgi:hypothetical protein
MSALKQRVQGKADLLQVVVERVTKCVLYQKKTRDGPKMRGWRKVAPVATES